MKKDKLPMQGGKTFLTLNAAQDFASKHTSAWIHRVFDGFGRDERNTRRLEGYHVVYFANV